MDITLGRDQNDTHAFARWLLAIGHSVTIDYTIRKSFILNNNHSDSELDELWQQYSEGE